MPFMRAPPINPSVVSVENLRKTPHHLEEEEECFPALLPHRQPRLQHNSVASIPSSIDCSWKGIEARGVLPTAASAFGLPAHHFPPWAVKE